MIQKLWHSAIFRNSKTSQRCFARLGKIVAWAFESADTLEDLSRVGVGAEVSWVRMFAETVLQLKTVKPLWCYIDAVLSFCWQRCGCQTQLPPKQHSSAITVWGGSNWLKKHGAFSQVPVRSQTRVPRPSMTHSWQPCPWQSETPCTTQDTPKNAWWRWICYVAMLRQNSWKDASSCGSVSNPGIFSEEIWHLTFLLCRYELWAHVWHLPKQVFIYRWHLSLSWRILTDSSQIHCSILSDALLFTSTCECIENPCGIHNRCCRHKGEVVSSVGEDLYWFSCLLSLLRESDHLWNS